jgi:hypothetical protein
MYRYKNSLLVSRQHYYDIKGTIEEEGLEGLIAKSKSEPRYANRVSDIIEKRILEYSFESPVAGQKRVANDLVQGGHIVSDGGVLGVWLRHKLTTKALRLKRLEDHHKKTNWDRHVLQRWPRKALHRQECH